MTAKQPRLLRCARNDSQTADSDTVIKALLDELLTELKGDVMTLGEQLYAKGAVEGRVGGRAKAVEATLKAISLIHQQLDDATIVAQTDLDLEFIHTLRKEILH
jgi:hypothetical protein